VTFTLESPPAAILTATREPWTPTGDDASRLARAVCDRLVSDWADIRRPAQQRARVAAAWFGSYAYAPCDLGWCAMALSVTPGALAAELRGQIARLEAEREAHAEDLRRRRGKGRRPVNRSSWAGHVMLAALVTRVTGGEWVEP